MVLYIGSIYYYFLEFSIFLRTDTIIKAIIVQGMLPEISIVVVVPKQVDNTFILVCKCFTIAIEELLTPQQIHVPRLTASMHGPIHQVQSGVTIHVHKVHSWTPLSRELAAAVVPADISEVGAWIEGCTTVFLPPVLTVCTTVIMPPVWTVT